jgi:hypothetical protein
VGGAEEGQGGGESGRAGEGDAGGGQTGPEAHWCEKRRQEFKAGGRSAEGAWPDEGGAEAARSRGGRKAACGAGDGGSGGGGRAGRRGRVVWTAGLRLPQRRIRPVSEWATIRSKQIGKPCAVDRG